MFIPSSKSLIIFIFFSIIVPTAHAACVLRIDNELTIRVEANASQEIGIYRGNQRVFHDPIRDGTHLSCGKLKRYTPLPRMGNWQNWTHAFNQDNPWTGSSHPPFTYSEPGDVRVNGDLIAVRHGRLRDLLRFYQLHRNAEGKVHKISAYSFVVRDDKHYGVAPRQSPSGWSFVIVYGKDKDLYTQFCYHKVGSPLTRSPGNSRGLGKARDCSISAENHRFKEASIL